MGNPKRVLKRYKQSDTPTNPKTGAKMIEVPPASFLPGEETLWTTVVVSACRGYSSANWSNDGGETLNMASGRMTACRAVEMANAVVEAHRNNEPPEEENT